MLERRPQWALHLGATALAMLVLLFQAPTGPPYDFCTYYTAGHVTLDNNAGAAFDFDSINQAHRENHPVESRIGTFVYSPLFLIPAALFSRLGFETAQVANQLLMLLSLSVLLFLLLQRTEGFWLKGLLCLVFVVSDPVTNQFIYQNWSVHLALFVGLAIHFTLDGRRLPAALSWALAIHLKAYVGLFLVPLLFLGKRRLVVTILAVGLALIVLSLPWVGADSYSAYVEGMREQAQGWVTYFFNQVSVQSTIARYEFPPSHWPASITPPTLPFLDFIFWLALPIFGLLSFRLRRDESRALAITVPFLLLFFPKIWDHTQILFFTLFLTDGFVRRTKAVLLVYLLLSWPYFALVQHLLVEALRGVGSAGIIHALLLYYPVLNLLTVAAILAPPEKTDAPHRPADAGT